MDPLEHRIQALEEEMRRLVPMRSAEPDLLYGMLHYHLGWADRDFKPATVDGGKRIRPLILLLATEAQGGDWYQALPAAAAVELLHNFTLIHDDIEDQDALRRGRDTLWSIWGIPQAINAGDALFALAYRGMLSLSDHGVPEQLALTATRRFTEAILRITEGQCRDLAFESQDIVDEAAYLQMIEGKTAALIGLAAELGAIIAGAQQPNAKALRDFGEALGKAFQMQDDLLGLWGDPSQTGKPIASDLHNRKKTLPILHGMATSPVLRKQLLNPSFDAQDIPQALIELDHTGSRAYTEAQARAFHRQALDALQRSKGCGSALETLRHLTERLVERQK